PPIPPAPPMPRAPPGPPLRLLLPIELDCSLTSPLLTYTPPPKAAPPSPPAPPAPPAPDPPSTLVCDKDWEWVWMSSFDWLTTSVASLKVLEPICDWGCVWLSLWLKSWPTPPAAPLAPAPPGPP